MKSSSKIVIYLIYEDKSKQMIEGWIALAKKIVRLVNPNCRTDLIDFSPVLNKELKWAAIPSNWMSSNPKDYQKLIQFRRFLANLLLEENSFVFFHFDADCPYHDFYNENKNKNFYDKYLNGILPYIQSIIYGHLSKQHEMAQSHLIDNLIKKIMTLIPSYSIEAWLYQNFRVIFQIFDRDFSNHSDRKLFENWQKDPGQLDEIIQIKEKTALQDQYNSELATGSFPAQNIYDIGKSFHDSIQRIMDCKEFLLALEKISTWY
jgi:hypothetical protein